MTNEKFKVDLGYKSAKEELRPKWPELFMELAIRAMRRVHLEYGIWSVGQQGQPNFPMLGRLNGGPGIELADERAVCAAITLEFINSQMTSGINRPTLSADQTELSHYDLDREWHYYDEKTKSADITLRRICDNSKGKNAETKRLPRVVIECKRFQLARPERGDSYGITGRVEYDKPQLGGIRKDVCKLLKAMTDPEAKESFFSHLFVWGIWPVGMGIDGEETAYKTENLSDALAELETDCATLTVHQIRWLPLDFKTPNSECKPTEIRRCLWATLIEVKSCK